MTIAYTEFEAEMVLDQSLTVLPSISSFRRAFNAQVSELKISIRIKKDVAKCETCSGLTERLRSITLTKQGREAIIQEIVKHKRFVRGVRNAYYSRIRNAIASPKTHASVIIGERMQ